MNLTSLPARDSDGNLNVVVESPRGARVKLKYEPEAGIFKFSRPLVLGVAYPYDWGFIPSTRAEDGDPLDAMIYHDVASFPGVVVPSRAIGVVKLVQKEPKTPKRRNDRLIVVPAHEKRLEDATQIDERVREELEQFFRVVVLMTAKKVHIEGWAGPKLAAKLVARACKREAK
ncbi:MAG TPA: inorganic diphosphatase [Polyangiaceae bacterium]